MRPVGVTLSAYFQFVRAALLAILALGIRFVGGMASRLASLATEGNSVQQFLSSLGHFLFMAFLIYALILVILGFGLLMGQNWARSLTVVLSGLGFLVLLPRLIHPHPLSVLFGALNLVVLIYLLLPQTRLFFDRRRITEIKPA
jgi:Predicted membrane protein (DUF2127)